MSYLIVLVLAGVFFTLAYFGVAGILEYLNNKHPKIEPEFTWDDIPAVEPIMKLGNTEFEGKGEGNEIQIPVFVKQVIIKDENN